MTEYRIIEQTTYKMWCPVVWTVQRSEEGVFGTKWVNIKSFDRRVRAVQLLNSLRG